MPMTHYIASSSECSEMEREGFRRSVHKQMLLGEGSTIKHN